MTRMIHGLLRLQMFNILIDHSVESVRVAIESWTIEDAKVF